MYACNLDNNASIDDGIKALQIKIISMKLLNLKKEFDEG